MGRAVASVVGGIKSQHAPVVRRARYVYMAFVVTAIKSEDYNIKSLIPAFKF